MRASNALGSLRQLKVEITRANSTRTILSQEAVTELRSRSEDLRRYLSDLGDAYRDLNG